MSNRLGQVGTGQVRSREVKVISGWIRTYKTVEFRSGQDQIRSGQTMSVQFNFRLGQVKAGRARSCQTMSGRGQDTYGKVKF